MTLNSVDKKNSSNKIILNNSSKFPNSERRKIWLFPWQVCDWICHLYSPSKINQLTVNFFYNQQSFQCYLLQHKQYYITNNRDALWHKISLIILRISNTKLYWYVSSLRQQIVNKKYPKYDMILYIHVDI